MENGNAYSNKMALTIGDILLIEKLITMKDC